MRIQGYYRKGEWKKREFFWKRIKHWRSKKPDRGRYPPARLTGFLKTKGKGRGVKKKIFYKGYRTRLCGGGRVSLKEGGKGEEKRFPREGDTISKKNLPAGGKKKKGGGPKKRNLGEKKVCVKKESGVRKARGGGLTKKRELAKEGGNTRQKGKTTYGKW